MNAKGFSGISFPFRFSGRGGVATSTTDPNNFNHIKESITQIIGTSIGERVNEVTFGSEVMKQQFKNITDYSDESLLKLFIQEAITKWESRVELLDIDITPIVESNGKSYTYVDVHFKVLKYLKEDSVRVKVE